MTETTRTLTTGTGYPAPTIDTIDALDEAVERVKGASQIISKNGILLRLVEASPKPQQLSVLEVMLRIRRRIEADDARARFVVHTRNRESAKLSGKVAQ